MISINRELLQYRKGVQIIIIKNGKMLLFQSPHFKKNEWGVPGGGLIEGESEEVAVMRELSEEFPKNQFKLCRKSSFKTTYEWDDETIRGDLENKKWSYRGQDKSQFLVELLDDDIFEYDLNEVCDLKWVELSEIECHVKAGRYEDIKKALEEFGYLSK